jgi:hypothetical protein
MFEAKLLNGNILKKIVEAIKDVVNDVNIDVSPSGKYHAITPFNFETVLRHNTTVANFEFRSVSTGNGWLACCSCKSQFEHGGIRALPR